MKKLRPFGLKNPWKKKEGVYRLRKGTWIVSVLTTKGIEVMGKRGTEKEATGLFNELLIKNS